MSLGVITKHLQVSFNSGPAIGSAAKKPGCCKVKISSGKSIKFERDQYSFQYPHSWTHAKSSSPATTDDRHNQEVLVAVTVYNSEFPSNFAYAELDGARRAGVLHRSLHHPCDAYLSTILSSTTALWSTSTLPVRTYATTVPSDQRSLQGVSHRQITSTKFAENVFCNLSSRAPTVLMMDIFSSTEQLEGRSLILSR